MRITDSKLWLWLLAGGIVLTACSSVAAAPIQKNKAAAASVPTRILREVQAGTPQIVEIGDHVEIHLPESSNTPWTLANQSDRALSWVDERIEIRHSDPSRQTPVHVFRFATQAVGRYQLAFTNTDRSLTFFIEVR
jgi:hypothetical protein